MRQYKVKTCPKCGKEFRPTQSRQQWCPECGEQERSKNSEAYRRTHIGLEWDKMPVPSAFQEGDYVVDRKGFRGYVEDTHGQLVTILDENNPNHHCGYDVDSLKLVLAPATNVNP